MNAMNGGVSTTKGQGTQFVLVQRIFQVLEVQGIAPLAGYLLLPQPANPALRNTYWRP